MDNPAVTTECHKLVLEPIVPKLGHMKKYLIATLMGDITRHDPWRHSFEGATYQVLKIIDIIFRSFASILFLLPLVTFGKD